MTREDETFVTEVTDLLREEHQAACQDAHPPAAGVVWWRAERRMRQEAAQAATRPMTVVHALALASGAGVAAALLQYLMPWLRQWISVAGGLTRFLEWDVTTLTTPAALTLALVALVWLVLAPIALYVTLSDD